MSPLESKNFSFQLFWGVGYKLIGFGQTLWIRLNSISIITLNIWILNWWIQSPVPNFASCEENWKITNFRNIYNNELLNYNILGCQMKPRSLETNRLSKSFSTLKSPIQEKAKFGKVWLKPIFFAYSALCLTRNKLLTYSFGSLYMHIILNYIRFSAEIF